MEAGNQDEERSYFFEKGVYDILVQFLHAFPNNEYGIYVLGLVVKLDVDTNFDEEGICDFICKEILNQRGIETIQMVHHILQFDFYNKNQTLELAKEINSKIWGYNYFNNNISGRLN